MDGGDKVFHPLLEAAEALGQFLPIKIAVIALAALVVEIHHAHAVPGIDGTALVALQRRCWSSSPRKASIRPSFMAARVALSPRFHA